MTMPTARTQPDTRFSIGTRYRTRHRTPRVCTVVDVWRTYNAAGQLVQVRYVTTHDGPFGQTVTEYDVLETTIAMGEIR
jgi:hypothetical protein